MDLTLIGATLTAVGVLLTIGAIWYARNQSKKLADSHRNEMISLWAHLGRVRTLLMQIQRITDDDGFIDNGTLTADQQHILPQIFKGLCDEYVRVAELIVKKKPNVTTEDVEQWTEAGKIKTDWQKQQFMNLITEYTDEKSEIK